VQGKTRYLVIASLLVLAVGIATGLVAYHLGQPPSPQPDEPAELRLLPGGAAAIAYADVRRLIASNVGNGLARLLPGAEDRRRDVEETIGIKLEDVDHVVACLQPNEGVPGPMRAFVLARGRFDEPRIEGLLRDRGARVERYRDRRLIVGGTAPQGQIPAVAFLEPGLVVIGDVALLHAAIDRLERGTSVLRDDELMRLIRPLQASSAWAVGRFDALRSTAAIPPAMVERLPPIAWLSASARISDRIDGALRAEARDEEAASNLRDLVRGFVAFARLQVGADPRLHDIVQSLEVGGDHDTVTVSLSVPSTALAACGGAGRPEPHQRVP
jgi:hypothetical protein